MQRKPDQRRKRERAKWNWCIYLMASGVQHRAEIIEWMLDTAMSMSYQPAHNRSEHKLQGRARFGDLVQFVTALVHAVTCEYYHIPQPQVWRPGALSATVVVCYGTTEFQKNSGQTTPVSYTHLFIQIAQQPRRFAPLLEHCFNSTRGLVTVGNYVYGYF